MKNRIVWVFAAVSGAMFSQTQPPVARRGLFNRLRTPRFFRVALLALAAFFVAPVHAAGLNDTGFAVCADGGSSNLSCAPTEPAGYPRQDGRYGRDAAAAAGVLGKVGGGSAGFDFTKIANDGSDLAATATLGTNPGDWACTRDNVTGLVWEVKTTSGLRSKDHTYTWYNSDTTRNGGGSGSPNGGTCSGGSGCDTEKFVADVNATALCGYADWRMPTVNELLSLVDYSRDGPATFDATYFPDTNAYQYWSANSYVQYPTMYAWIVILTYGADGGAGKASSGAKGQVSYVRLVRGG